MVIFLFIFINTLKTLQEYTRNFELDKPSFEDGISLLNPCIDMRTPIPIHNS